MEEFVKVARTSDLSPGQTMLVQLSGERILLSNIDGDFYAVEEVCTHAGGPLSEGKVEGIEVICPRHGSRFNLKTGGVTGFPASGRLARYRVRVNGDDVLIGPSEE